MIKRSIFFQLARIREWKKIQYREVKKLRVMREEIELGRRKEDKKRLCNKWKLEV